MLYNKAVVVWGCYCHSVSLRYVTKDTRMLAREGNMRLPLSLQWRHNGRDNASNHQPPDCLLNRSFGRRSKKTLKLRVTVLCAENSPGAGEFPAQKPSNAENVSIWWRHHEESSWGHHGTHLGPVDPRWASCWPHEPCYQGTFVSSKSNLRYEIVIVTKAAWIVKFYAKGRLQVLIMIYCNTKRLYWIIALHKTSKIAINV